MALDKSTGRTVWGEDGKAGACASAAPFTFNGKPAFAMVAMDPSGKFCTIVGVDSATGAEPFRSPPWKEKWGAACVDILVDGPGAERLFITTAEQLKRSARFTRVGNTFTQDWMTARLSTYTGNCVLLGAHLYAANARGALTCVFWPTGEERWSQRGGFGEHGNLIAADGKLFVQRGKTGEVVIVEASPKAFREIERVRVFEEKADTFTAPTLADGVLYCRSYAGRLIALEVR